MVVPDTRGTRYVLPPRGLPWLKAIAAGLILMGLVFEGMYFSATASMWWPSLTGGGFDPLALLILLIGVSPVAFVICVALLIGWGHGEVLITETGVVGTDRFGPIRYQRRIAFDDIDRLVVDTGGVKVNGKPVQSGPWADVVGLTAERKKWAGATNTTGRGTMLVLGYPRAMVEALCEEIRARAGASAGAEIGVSTREADGAMLCDEGAPVQPASSTALIERSAEGFTITLPALGFFKGSKGLGLFSIVWMAFCSVFLVVAVSSVPAGGFLDALPFVGFSLMFMSVGVVMFFIALRMGRRRAVIDAAGEDLVITRQSIGEPKTQSWHRSEIARVAAGPSGMEVNNRPVLELQIHPTSGKKVGLFRERHDDELAWIAAEIRAALGVAS